MEFNFPLFRVQQRSIPKFESCTVYPGMVAVLAGQGETLPQSPVSCGCSSGSLCKASWGDTAGAALACWKVFGSSCLSLLFSFCWQDVVVAVCHLQTAQAILWGDLVKALGRWPLTSMTSNLHVPGSWYFQACLFFFFLNPFFNLLIEQPVQQTFFRSQTGYCLWTSLFTCNLFCFVWLERKCQHIRLCSLLRGMKARVRRRDNGLGFPGTSLSHFLPSQAPWES